MFSSDQALPSGIVGDITGVTAGAGLTGGGTTGTVTLNLDNTIAPTTSVTTPVVIGGTTTTSTLSLRSTSGVGTTGADIIFQTGNNGATEAARISNGGVLLLGTTSSRAIGSISANIQIEGTSSTGMSIARNSNDATGGILTFGKSRGTVVGAFTAVTSGDDLGYINFVGGDGTNLVRQAARILAEVDGTVSTGIMPGSMSFLTTNSAGASTTAVRISSSQHVGVGAVPLARLHIDGSFSQTAWTTSGIGLRQDLSTYTDTSSSGTVAAVAINSFLGGAIAASSATTYTDASLIRFVGPTAGANVIMTTPKVLQTVFTSFGLETMAASFQNSSNTTGTAVTLDLNPTSSGSATRSVQIVGVNTGGGLSSALAFRTSSAAVPAEAMRILGTKEIIIGDAARYSVAGNNSNKLQLYNTTGDAAINVGAFSANTSGPMLNLLKSRNASVGGFTIVQSGDTLGQINFVADDGTDYTTVGARIFASVDGTPGTDDMPTALIFATTPDGSNTLANRMRISSEGLVGIGVTGPTAVLHIKAGTTAASAAPLKFTSGSLQTTAEAGAHEFLTDDYYLTITTGAARKKIVLAETSGAVRVPQSGAALVAGNATLVGGTVTVNTTAATTNAKILLTRKTAGGTAGNITYTISAGTSFTINSDSGTDTATFTYVIFEGY